MSWLSDFIDDIEQHTIRPIAHTIADAYDDVEDEIKRSEIAQAALVTTGVVLAGPAVLPVLGSAASGAGHLVLGTVEGAGTLAGGAIKTTGNVLSNLWSGVTGVFKGKEALPYIADAELPASLQQTMGTTASGLPYITESQLPAALQIAESGGLGEILGNVVKAVPGAISTLANVLPAVQTIFGDKDSAGPITQSSVPKSTEPIIVQTGTGQQTGTAQPVFFQTPAAASGSPNLALYAAIAIGAYFLLR